MTVIIIGGGASGLMAALSAAEGGERVLLLERQARVAKKLMATGNGRCNLSNRHAAIEHYHGLEPGFCQTALRLFDVESTLDFFAGLGLATVEERDGRLYPFSDSANSVCDVLRLAADQLEVETVTGAEVTAVKRQVSGFSVSARDGRIWQGERLIIACGGAAGAKVGGVSDGYRLLESLGHRCTPLQPSLTQIKTDRERIRPLKGVRAKAALQLLDGQGQCLQAVNGEIQFTDFGLSGPAAFDLSRRIIGNSDLSVQLDMLPPLASDELQARLRERQQRFSALKTEHLLTGLLHNRLALTLLRQAGLNPATALADLSHRQLAAISQLIKNWRLPVLGLLGFEAAQVTAGGIYTHDFDPKSMESRLVPGLYACGEVLDIDGDCGGFNLQWAWSSGRIAGLAAGGLL